MQKKVTDSDVAYRVASDFDVNAHQSVIEALARYGQESHETSPHMIRLAILRLANGDSQLVTDYVELAKTDWRDILNNIHNTYGENWLDTFLPNTTT